MDEKLHKLLVLGGFALFVTIGFFATMPLQFTGHAIQSETCTTYYERWSQESWFNDWQWWKDHCYDFNKQNLKEKEFLCGNGILEPGEQCDTNEIVSCSLIGLQGGNMKCTHDCMWDVRNCDIPDEVNYDIILQTENKLIELKELRSTLSEEHTQCMIELNECEISINSSGNLTELYLENCIKWNDGCNICFYDGNNNVETCTEIYCKPEDYGEPYCIEYIMS
ncbi:MAG: hypothetical protein ACMXYE_02225 [Candidatus Woesearchaeota archaeon]